MKKVDEITRLRIMDLIAEQALGIAEFALEKDFVVFDVLRALSTLHHPDFDLVFCGGTCLSKAYGLLDRVSEDVDIKVVNRHGVDLRGNALRSALSRLKAAVIAQLLTVGFDRDLIRVTARDGNRYIVLDAAYGSHFEHSPAMRANMKIELNHTVMALPAVRRPIGLLFDVLAHLPPSASIEMDCVDMREALVEKMVSFPRRLALWLQDPSRGFDKALVRHLYDVYEVSEKMPEVIAGLKQLRPLMLATIEKDAADFASHHPGFVANPVAELTCAMSHALHDSSIRTMFDEFVSVMVYSSSVPMFDPVVARYAKILDELLPA